MPNITGDNQTHPYSQEIIDSCMDIIQKLAQRIDRDLRKIERDIANIDEILEDHNQRLDYLESEADA